MKDSLLSSYTFEELLYEFHSIREDALAMVERVEQESDKIEEAKEQATMDWVDQMEAEDAADLTPGVVVDPAIIPSNIQWMEEQLALDKEKFGEDFGNDLNLNFNSSDESDT